MRTPIRTATLTILLLLVAGHRVDADDRREEGARIVEQQIEALDEKAREHEVTVRRIHDSCLGSVSVPTTRGSGEVASALLPACQALQSDAVRLDAEVREGIEKARDDARRMGVYPGTVRKLLRSHRLEKYT